MSDVFIPNYSLGTCIYCTSKNSRSPDELLHCGKCQRLAHSTCLRSGVPPGQLEGDNFFEFTCQPCAKIDTDIVFRANLSITQLLLLTMYNLHMKNPDGHRKGFFHWKLDIFKFIVQHWNDLFQRDGLGRKKRIRGTVSAHLSRSPHLFAGGHDLLNDGGWYKLCQVLPPAVLLHQEAQKKKDRNTNQGEPINKKARFEEGNTMDRFPVEEYCVKEEVAEVPMDESSCGSWYLERGILKPHGSLPNSICEDDYEQEEVKVEEIKVEEEHLEDFTEDIDVGQTDVIDSDLPLPPLKESLFTHKTPSVSNPEEDSTRKKMPGRGTANGRKLVTLSVTKKLELIRKLEAGATVKSVCEEYGVKKQTVSDIRKAKDKLLAFSLKYNVTEGHENSSLGNRKRMRVSKDGNLEEAVTKWFVQQRSCGVKVRGIAIQDAAQKLARHMGINDFTASDGWLWRFRNRHGLCDKVLHREVGSAPVKDVEPFRQKLNKLIKDEGLLTSQIYNADESGLFWRCIPKNMQAFRDEKEIHGEKISKERISFLCCANADGLHRLPLAVVGKCKCPRVLKDCMNHLPVHYYNSQKAWFNMDIFQDWFFKHFIPAVWKFQEEVLEIDPKDVKALLILDNAPTHPSESSLVSHDGKVRVLFLPPSVTSLIQPMDQSVIYSCKRLYQRKYLDEVLCVIDDDDAEVDRKGEKTKENILNYNIKGAIFNIATAWKEVKTTTLANAWKKLLYGTDDVEYDFEGLEPNDFHRLLKKAGEHVSLDDVREWLEETEGDPGHHVITDEDIAKEVLKGDTVQKEDDEGNDSDVQIPKLSVVRGALDTIIAYIDLTADEESNQYYPHLRSLRNMIIRRQHRQGKQLKINSFFKPVVTAAESDSPQASTSFQSPDSPQPSPSGLHSSDE